MRFTPAQQKVIDLMRTTGKPLVKRKYRTNGQDVTRYSVGASGINNQVAQSLCMILEGGGLEYEAMGNVQKRSYTLTKELANVS